MTDENVQPSSLDAINAYVRSITPPSKLVEISPGVSIRLSALTDASVIQTAFKRGTDRSYLTFTIDDKPFRASRELQIGLALLEESVEPKPQFEDLVRWLRKLGEAPIEWIEWVLTASGIGSKAIDEAKNESGETVQEVQTAPSMDGSPDVSSPA